MEQHTNDHDATLERALKEEFTRERSLMAESFGVFTGRRRFWNIAVAVETFAFFSVSVFAAARFFGAEEVDAKLLWATVFLGGLVIMTALKFYLGLQMLRNEVLREVKRLELRVAERHAG